MANVIDVSSRQVTELLAELGQRAGNMEPFLLALGEEMLERTKERFGRASAPDGTPWAANSPVTLARYIESRGGKTPAAKKKGAALPAKKPLIATGEMSRGLHYGVDEGGLTLASPAPQAFMMHFGGTKGEFPRLWGDIPARPFFPIQANGTLYPAEEAQIIESLRHYLTLE